MVAGRTGLLITGITLGAAIGEDGKTVEIDETGNAAVGAIDGLDQRRLRILSDDLKVGRNFGCARLRAGAAALIEKSSWQKYAFVASSDCQGYCGLAIDTRRRSEQPYIGNTRDGRKSSRLNPFASGQVGREDAGRVVDQALIDRRAFNDDLIYRLRRARNPLREKTEACGLQCRIQRQESDAAVPEFAVVSLNQR